MDLSFSEQLLRVVFSIFCGQKKIVASAPNFDFECNTERAHTYLLMNWAWLRLNISKTKLRIRIFTYLLICM